MDHEIVRAGLRELVEPQQQRLLRCGHRSTDWLRGVPVDRESEVTVCEVDLSDDHAEVGGGQAAG